VNVSVGLYTERWLFDDPNAEVTAGELVAIMWFITGILTPLFGYLIDLAGFRALIVKLYF
jgi:hypothetical protein